MQFIYQISHVIEHVTAMQTFSATKAREENFSQILNGRDDHIVIRQWAVAQVVDRTDFVIRLNDALSKTGQLLFQAEIGCHVAELLRLGRTALRKMKEKNATNQRINTARKPG